MEELFSQIYRDNAWNDPCSRSGTGSNLVQTSSIRRALPGIIERFGVKSLLDIPCGDFFWMKEIQPILSVMLDRYIGADIVADLVNSNSRSFSDSKFTFGVYDIQSSLLPKVDMVLCRDCFVHFSYEDIFTSLRNIKKSRSRYLLATTFPGRTNRHIVTGAWFPLNLQRFPFYFPRPLELIQEDCTEYDRAYTDKSIALWEIRTIPILRLSIALFVFSLTKKMRSFAKRSTIQTVQR
jgi:hypothetical protein